MHITISPTEQLLADQPYFSFSFSERLRSRSLRRYGAPDATGYVFGAFIAVLLVALVVATLVPYYMTGAQISATNLVGWAALLVIAALIDANFRSSWRASKDYVGVVDACLGYDAVAASVAPYNRRLRHLQSVFVASGHADGAVSAESIAAIIAQRDWIEKESRMTRERIRAYVVQRQSPQRA